jgi:hypothetical protein
MATLFIAITLTGFIPDSLAKIAAVQTGERPPFPLVLHLHSILMGSFLLLLFAQSALAATGRMEYHQRLGVLAALIAPAIVLVPTMYHQIWNGMQTAPPEAQSGIQAFLSFFDNIMLVQIRVGILFALFILIALMARKGDSGLHKRMMFLAIAPALPAAFDRITWLPHLGCRIPFRKVLFRRTFISCWPWLRCSSGIWCVGGQFIRPIGSG